MKKKLGTLLKTHWKDLLFGSFIGGVLAAALGYTYKKGYIEGNIKGYDKGDRDGIHMTCAAFYVDDDTMQSYLDREVPKMSDEDRKTFISIGRQITDEVTKIL